MFSSLILTGCKDDNTNAPKFIGQKPVPVTQYSVVNSYGGAKISFKIPASEDLLYVKAEYSLSSGVKRETKSSLYKDYLYVDGFEKAGEYEIKLYAVAKGEVVSDPTTVKINVLTPPYQITRKTVNLIETFGGVNVSFQNDTKADLSIQLLEKDAKGVWKEKYTYYSNSSIADFSVRGYAVVPKEFGVCVKDRWGNISDTLVKTCTPIFEELIPKSTWKKFALPGDWVLPHPTYPQWAFEKMWDGKIGADDMFHTAALIDTWPAFFTIDLGKTIKFSRMKFFQRQSSTSFLYAGNNIRKFELYGSNNPTIDGSWDSSWTKMGSFEIIKPSGAALGTNTQEDIAVAAAGHDLDISALAPSYRYIRLKVIETWGRVQSFNVAEITFWGRVEQ
jgi:hypothetical protein